jgi:hypothetical protein
VPYRAPGHSVYVTNGSSSIYLHGQPVIETRDTGEEVGIAVKQKAAHWSDGLTAQNQIQIGEPYLILRSGVVQVAVPNGSTFNDGDPIYITSANVLTTTASSNTAFGRVVETTLDGRGVPTGFVRVNLDERNSF